MCGPAGAWRAAGRRLGNLGLRGQLALGLRVGLRHHPALLAVALVVDAPLAILGLAGERSGSAVLAFVLGLPLVALVNPVAKAATVVAVDRVLAGRPVSPWSAYRPVLARFGTVAALCVLWFAAVALGVAALVVPGIVLLVAGQCLMGAAVLEGHGVRGAAARSRELVMPAFWSVLALFLLLEVAGGVAGSLVDLAFAPVVETVDGAGWFVAVAGRAAVSPFVYAMPAVLFLDRRAALARQQAA
ncbi:MAG TPA: hypothetical protein VD813_10125, partial [Pseudonocardia sp.]|nr:hypothetical protein [Pseudonocardia sp.]